MKKLQAAMKDASANRARGMRHCYKVGSYFKGCHQCGDFHWEKFGGRDVKRYDSGYNVFRSYSPSATKWTYYCWDCSAKDAKAWEDANDIGQDAICGTRDAIKKRKYFLRNQAVAFAKANAPKEPNIKEAIVATSSLAAQIRELEEKIKQLEQKLKGGK